MKVTKTDGRLDLTTVKLRFTTAYQYHWLAGIDYTNSGYSGSRWLNTTGTHADALAALNNPPRQLQKISLVSYLCVHGLYFKTRRDLLCHPVVRWPQSWQWVMAKNRDIDMKSAPHCSHGQLVTK